MVQRRCHGGHGATGTADGLDLRDTPRDRLPAHGTADALCRQHGAAARHGTVDARGADDDTLLGHFLLPSTGHAQLRCTPAAPPRDVAAPGFAGMDMR